MNQRTVTGLLRRWGTGDPEAFSLLIDETYAKLRQIAVRQMRGEKSERHSLQPDELLHEALLEVMKLRELDWQNCGHFYAVMTRMMQRQLLQQLRGARSLKRGGGWRRVEFEESILRGLQTRSPESDQMNAALEGLRHWDERKARLVELRFFCGLTAQEIGEHLGVSVPTVQREWRLARTWLQRALSESLTGG